MKKSFLFSLLLLGILSLGYAQNTILEARGMAAGTVVTVKGIATHGSELGIIRYFQDGTAGIAAYGATVGVVNRGDSITVTGTLKMYNQLLELDPLTNVTVRSTGNPVPDPIELTPAQIAEPYEAMLVKINNATFADAGGVFTQKKYLFTANGETGYIYVKTSQTDIIGQPIPSGLVNITAVVSQFDYNSPTAGYQLLPRKMEDLQLGSSIYLTNVLTNTAFTHTTLDFSWNTNVAGTTQMFYGLTAETVIANLLNGVGGATSHTLDLSGLNAGEITWVQAFSVSGSDTAKSAIRPYATISNSTGDMKSYFNSPVDVTYSKGVDAIYLPSTIDDTLINYINRAKYSIDLTIYNFNNAGISNISTALKAAANRGVRVRVIGCGTTANLGIDELVGSAVHLLIGPSSSQRLGIMHNKFVIFDAQSANANDPILWTGSTNFTDGQINLDANNVIIVQDQSLARSYQIEFEEMWGSYADEPNAAKARFGSTKKNNTPHEFMINGKRVECYFSPTDGVNARIVEVINTANNDLSIATMLITRNEMATAIAARKSAGVAVNVLTNAEGNNAATVNATLSASLTTHYTFDDVSSGIMHHKYMIVDQDAPASDPMVFTGSHNWSAAADNENDENTLVIHDATLANVYYQNFVKRFVDNLGILEGELTTPPTAVDDQAETKTIQSVTVSVLDNDMKQAPVTLTIEQQASHGIAEIPFTNPNVVTYTPTAGFYGKDSLTYKIAYTASPNLFATAKVYINVVNDAGIAELSGQYNLKVSPNPVVNGIFQLSAKMPSAQVGKIQLIDMTGKIVYSASVSLVNGDNNLIYSMPAVSKGIYFLKLSTPVQTAGTRVIFE